MRSVRTNSLARGMASLCILAALAVGACNETEPPKGHAEESAEPKPYDRGPHGGRLLKGAEFDAEVSIYERGVPPEFRVFFYDGDRPLPPGEFTLNIALTRHGNRIDPFTFKPQEDYLLGDHTVEEPHSFDVDIKASRGGVTQAWKYAQREGRVALSEAAVQSSAISIETAGPVKMKSVLELPGEIGLNGDKLAHVVPRMAGVLREIRKNQGDAVTKGEVIAVLDSRELAEAKRAYLEGAEELAFARKNFEREEGLFKKNIASEASYLQAERDYHEARLKLQSAQQQLGALGITKAALEALTRPDSQLTRYDLRAPFAGVLIEKRVAIGQAVEATADLFTLADLSDVWVTITVYPKDLNAVKVGQDVTVTSDTLGTSAEGKITYIGSLVGEQTRSAQARVVLPDPEHRWKPGLFVTVHVTENEVTVPVAVKREGLQKFRDWDVVFVRAGNEFEARPLELGRRDGEWVEVVSGLKAGEAYAVANSFILKADVGKAGASHDH